MTPANDDDRLQLDYQQTIDLLRSLTDVRFKLLAFVPTISGAAVGLLGHPRPAAELLAVGLLGLFATLGILLYELRNTRVFEYATRRAQLLEARLRLPSPFRAAKVGGLYSEAPGSSLRVLRVGTGTHETGLGLVYGAAFAGWSYLVAWGALHALDVEAARKLGAVVGAVVGALVVLQVARITALGPAGDPEPATDTGPS